MGQVFVFVLGFSFLLLLVAFHSIVIPIKAIILNLLSTGAAYGLLVLVFQEGWGADILNVKPGVIESFVPIFIFTILFGLSMDYHVFILTRIKEARDRGLCSDAAVERGISITAGTVTSAAAIMVAVFAVFVTLELAIIKQLGLRAGGRRLPGRDGHPQRAAAGVDEAARRLELVDAGLPVVDPARDDRGRVGRARAGRRGRARAGSGASGRDRLGAGTTRWQGLLVWGQPGMRTSTQTSRWSDEGTGNPAPVRRTSSSGGNGQNTAASTIFRDRRGRT